MDNEKFIFTMGDLKPEVRAEFEKWLGFKVGNWEIINEIYRAEEEPLDEALDIFLEPLNETLNILFDEEE